MDAAQPVLMPQLGNSMEEGTILRWLVQAGDSVQIGDPLFEVETDKAVLTVESEISGTLGAIVAPEGSVVPIKQPVAYFGESPATNPVPNAVPTAKENGPALPHREPIQTHTETSSLEPTRRRASPAARNAAKALGIQLEQCGQGSGPDGRLLRADIERENSERKPIPQPEFQSINPPVQVNAAGVQRSPLTKMRRAIARNLQQSKQTVPHFYTKVTVDAQAMLAYHAKNRAQFACSLNDVLVEAVAKAIAEFQELRTQIDGNELLLHPHANIGLAVAVPDGLLVPVLRKADLLSLRGLAQESKRIIEEARQGKVEAMGEGVCTISNLGMFGIEEFTAIINPPEASILAIGAVRETVLVEGGAMRAGKVCTLTLSADHRVVDGVIAAKFVMRLKEILEGLT
jgi:pyruvate dehydrogenase E2 component (dihydrolipoamide acetyltransferase)